VTKNHQTERSPREAAVSISLNLHNHRQVD